MTLTSESVLSNAPPHSEVVGQAALSVLHSACRVNPRVSGQEGPEGSVIVAIISLIGEVEWSVFLALPRQSASAVAARFAGFEIPFESNDMGDAVGELTNILAGEVKRLLDARGVKANISLPSVIRADSIHLLRQRGVRTLKTAIDCEAGAVWAGVIMQESASA
jgi:chemotaxis protein CheX